MQAHDVCLRICGQEEKHRDTPANERAHPHAHCVGHLDELALVLPGEIAARLGSDE